MDSISNDPRWQAMVKEYVGKTYLCDPKKNTECSKKVCAYRSDGMEDECTRTINKKYSVDGSKIGDVICRET